MDFEYKLAEVHHDTLVDNIMDIRTALTKARINVANMLNDKNVSTDELSKVKSIVLGLTVELNEERKKLLRYETEIQKQIMKLKEGNVK